MCVPKKSKRKKQVTLVQSTAVPKVEAVCLREEPPLEPSRPKLLQLTVTGAVPMIGNPGTYWEVQHPDLTITVTAITEPDTADAWDQLQWNVETEETNTYEVARATTGQRRIGAHIPGQPWAYVDIEIYDLTALTCDLPTKLNDRDRHWKAYASPTTAKVTATTVKNLASVWKHLTFSEGTDSATESEKLVDLSTVRDAAVKVSLGVNTPKSLVADLHICQWPVLEVQEIRFDAIAVIQDGQTNIDTPFPRRWTKGKAQQAPLCYAAGSKVTLTADLNVLPGKLATDTEDVKVKATADLGGGNTLTWERTVKVKAGEKTATFPSATSDNAIPAGVAIHEPFKITWSMIDCDNATWKPMGNTEQTLYVTLKPPSGGVNAYWTLLDISCRAGAGKLDEKTFVPAAFKTFENSRGDGNGIVRKGDGVRLSYYLNGVKTSAEKAEPTVYSTRGILSRADGTGRCGGWANLLIHLFNLHGITSGKKLWFVRDNPNAPKMTNRFLVKACTFNGAGTSNTYAGYTHNGNTECVKRDGIAGQGKTNPQFDFGDHVVVEHDGKIYDPSYGVGAIVGQRLYEDGAIDGVGRITAGIEFKQLDGTPQFISEVCGKGFIDHTVSGGEKLAAIVLFYGAPSESALFDHPYNAALKLLRVTADKIVDGDVVLIPRDLTTKPILRSKYV